MKIQNDTLWKKSFKILLQENVLVYCISILKVTFLGHPVVDVGDAEDKDYNIVVNDNDDCLWIRWIWWQRWWR